MSDAPVAILSVGDELVLGQVEDTNAPWIARELLALGVMPGERRTVADDRAAITDAILALSRTHRCVIVTGGLGPTPDDLTRESLADALALCAGASSETAALEEDPIGVAHLRAWFAARGRSMPPCNHKQAMRPRECRLLANPLGTAPGLATLDAAPLCVYCLPGPPHEMQRMFGVEIAPSFASPTRVLRTRVLHTVGVGESALAEMLGDLMERTREPLVGTTAQGGIVSIRIRATGSMVEVSAAIAATVSQCEARVGRFIFGCDDDTLAASIGTALMARACAVSTAESCTGGLVGALLTSVAGSSGWYLGGFVAYANERKAEDLEVSRGVIATDGAVSHATAVALARGACNRTGSDFSIATTGIAGPGGGTDDKPVGTVFVAIADRTKQQIYSRRFQFTGDRNSIRERSAVMALAAMRFAITEAPLQPLLWSEAEEVYVATW